MLALLKQALEVFLHLDAHLDVWTTTLGDGLYFLLFAVIFCETGLVITPFLPGDSLLFAVGALTARTGSPLNLSILLPLLVAAGIIGDAVNYAVGTRIGPRVFVREDSVWLNKKHLFRAQNFYERYGGKTIIFARFIPIVRSFAPFVAGVGRMSYRRFALFNVVGAIAWVVCFCGAGFLFGNIERIRRNFQYVILAIILISILPAMLEYLRARSKNQPSPNQPSPR